MKKVMAAVLIAGASLLIGPSTSAQTAAPQDTQHVIKDQDLQLLRKDICSQRKQLIMFPRVLVFRR